MTSPETTADHRAGRMLDGLIRTENENGRVTVTVSVKDAGGGRRLHETFDLRKWEGRSGPMLTMRVRGTGDYEAGIKAIQMLHFNVATGEVFPAKAEPRNQDELLRWAANKAWRYIATGEVPAPGNGTVEVQEEAVCGACGRALTDPDSIRLGLGRDCEKRLYGKATPRRSRAVRGARRAEGRAA